MAGEAEYTENFLRAHQNAVIGQAKLADAAQDLGSSDADRADALAAFLQATEEIADLRAADDAFMLRFGTINPPTAAQIQMSAALAAASGAAIAQAQMADAILAAITTLVDGWQNL